jgi:hypothetical protein
MIINHYKQVQIIAKIIYNYIKKVKSFIWHV